MLSPEHDAGTLKFYPANTESQGMLVLVEDMPVNTLLSINRIPKKPCFYATKSLI